MTKRNAIIFIKLDPPKKESEWNNWYNNKHIPDRLAIKGFNAARRFVQLPGEPPQFAIPGDPKYLSLYELSYAGVLKEEAYAKLWDKDRAMPPDSFESITMKLPRFSRGIYEQIYPEVGGYKPAKAPFLFVVGHEVPQNRQQEFNAWYNTEHIPAVHTTPGIINGRRFKLTKEIPPMTLNGGSLTTYLTIYDVENLSALTSEPFKKAGVSPWSSWVRSWFQRKMCVTYKRIYP